MLSSLYSGITGITAAGYSMSVVGNNIANANTVGFKAGYTSFADILNQSLGGAGGGGSQVGRGVELTGVGTVFGQGSFENTTNGTDLAIEGNGFFVVANDTGTYYSRAGQFIMDAEGYLVNPSGFNLQGYLADATGNIVTTLTDINVGQISSAPKPSDFFSITANLNAAAATNDTYATTITLYDSLGSAIPLTITFTKQAAVNQWNYIATVPAGTGTLGTWGVGSVVFDASGVLWTVNNDPSAFNDVTFVIDPTSTGANLVTVLWDLWDGTAGTATTDLTGYASDSDTTYLFQNGFSSGSIQSIHVDADGLLQGLFTNGQTKTMGQVVLADFISPWGLNKVGRSLFSESSKSGQPTIGLPGTGGRGRITSSSLEMSNVDMASEFVKMITTQRSYQANARVITTSDDMLAELMNIKR
jgi:flagellar hook protein FlgE